MGYFRMRPPAIEQRKKNSCWAVVLDSFSRVTAGVSRIKERNIMKQFGVKSNGYGLTASGIEPLRTFLQGTHGLTLDLVEFLNKYDIEDRLRKSHVCVMYQVKGNDWHALLVYGIDNFLCYMDPATGTYEKQPYYNFVSPRGFYVVNLA